MKKRLFIAIEVPWEIKEKIKLIPESRLKIVKSANLHITILFLGYVEEKEIERIKNVIKTVLEGIPVFTLKFKAIIFAPPGKQFRMIWALFDRNPDYELLNQRLSDTLSEFRPDNYKEKYIHITLARFKKPLSGKELQAIKLPKVNIQDFSADKITLYESVLRGSGPIYKVITEFPLKSPVNI